MRLLAFYLPQFHRIPENDEWWGEGFTEWVNVSAAKPLFEGHDHPRLPTELGQYDVTDGLTPASQSEMARAGGVDAFCMYFYWFDGKRLLERPLDVWREDPTLLPYCLSWANEPWTRRWDGRNKDVLMPQTYPADYEADLFAALLPHFEAPHYVRHDGKPVLLVHRSDLIPDGVEFSTRLREMAVDSGLPGLYLVCTETLPELDPRTYGFDAVAEFPPVSVSRLGNAKLSPVTDLVKGFRGRLLSYERVANHYSRRPRPPFTRHRGVMPMWDNTARRRSNATVYVGHSPARFGAWLAEALATEQTERGISGMVFVNAWNEWAEGAYLEPDRSHGREYLDVTARVRQGIDPTGASAAPLFRRGRVSVGHVRSLAQLAAGSLLARRRSWVNRRRPEQ